MPIKGYEGVYEASDLGHVRSLDRLNAIGRRVKGKPLAACKNNTGYLTIVLHKDSKGTSRLLHTVIAETWCENPNPETHTQVNHLRDDGSHLDNRACNLIWSTPRQNSEHSYTLAHNVKRMRRVTLEKDGQMHFFTSLVDAGKFLSATSAGVSYAAKAGTKLNGFAVLSEQVRKRTCRQSVVATDILGQSQMFETISEASRKTGSSRAGIGRVLSGKKTTHNGYRWSRVDAQNVSRSAA